MAKKLKIKLLPNGIIEMETIGVKGKKCMEYAKFMEEIANAKIKSQKWIMIRILKKHSQNFIV